MESLQSLKTLLKNRPLDQLVEVGGWIRSVRRKKAFSFVVLSDGSCAKNLQCIIDANIPRYEEVASLLTGASLRVEGKVVASAGQGQELELQITKVLDVGPCPDDFPLQKKETSAEFLRENAHLRIRTNLFGAVMRIRNTLSYETHRFFQDRGFFYVHTPVITGVDAEGAGEMFRVTTLNPTEGKKQNFDQDYFGKETSLTVSGQLEAECLAMGLSRVYTFGPTFRAENSNTARHLSEFWMIEPEVAYADLNAVAKLGTDYVKHLIRAALEQNRDDLEFLVSRDESMKDHLALLQSVVDKDFLRITYTEAVDILLKSGRKFEYPVQWGLELQTEHERYLTEVHFQSPLIVTNYPKECKAFYMKLDEDGKTVRAMDALVPGIGEIIGGSQREENLDRLLKRVEDLKMHKEALWWYLDLRKFGSVPHGGFGLGLERLMMYITGSKNIRDVIAFPRTPRSADF